MNHLLPTLRGKSDADLLVLMDAAYLLSGMASSRPADALVAEWIDGLGELASLELDRRNRAKEYQKNEVQRTRVAVQRDSLTAAFFGRLGVSPLEEVEPATMAIRPGSVIEVDEGNSDVRNSRP